MILSPICPFLGAAIDDSSGVVGGFLGLAAGMILFAVGIFCIIMTIRLEGIVQGVCPKCNYNLTGNTTGTCPECGHVVAAGGGA